MERKIAIYETKQFDVYSFTRIDNVNVEIVYWDGEVGVSNLEKIIVNVIDFAILRSKDFEIIKIVYPQKS